VEQLEVELLVLHSQICEGSEVALLASVDTVLTSVVETVSQEAGDLPVLPILLEF